MKTIVRCGTEKYELLTPDEKSRNTNKEAELFISPANKNFSKFSEKLYKENENEVTFKYAKSGLSGKILNWELSILKGCLISLE